MDMMIQLPLQLSSLKGIYIHIIAKIWNDVNQLSRPTSLVNISTNLFFPYHFFLPQQLGTQSKYRTMYCKPCSPTQCWSEMLINKVVRFVPAFNYFSAIFWKVLAPHYLHFKTGWIQKQPQNVLNIDSKPAQITTVESSVATIHSRTAPDTELI